MLAVLDKASRLDYNSTSRNINTRRKSIMKFEKYIQVIDDRAAEFCAVSDDAVLVGAVENAW